jgi:hypothetical protein
LRKDPASGATHEEITEMKVALAAAHCENLELRRRLGPQASR